MDKQIRKLIIQQNIVTSLTKTNKMMYTIQSKLLSRWWTKSSKNESFDTTSCLKTSMVLLINDLSNQKNTRSKTRKKKINSYNIIMFVGCGFLFPIQIFHAKLNNTNSCNANSILLYRVARVQSIKVARKRLLLNCYSQ